MRKQRTEQEEIEMRKESNALLLQCQNPGYATCMRCRVPWSHCEGKSVQNSKTSGSFALCTWCWDHSTVEERIVFYKALYYIHVHLGVEGYTAEDVERGVRLESEVENGSRLQFYPHHRSIP